MSEQLVNMTYRLSDGTETTYLVELQPENDFRLLEKQFYAAGMQAKQESIIKLFEALDTCDCDPDDGQAKHYRCGATQGLTPRQIMAFIQGEK
jgi:hypothetical protein